MSSMIGKKLQCPDPKTGMMTTGIVVAVDFLPQLREFWFLVRIGREFYDVPAKLCKIY